MKAGDKLKQLSGLAGVSAATMLLSIVVGGGGGTPGYSLLTADATTIGLTSDIGTVASTSTLFIDLVADVTTPALTADTTTLLSAEAA